MKSPLIETKLLKILDTILTQKNITKAARLLHMSQPAVSTALGKIRKALGDPLVISDGKTLILTERAIRIYPLIKATLTEIESMVSDQSRFDPSQNERLFKIASPDNVSQKLISNLFAGVFSGASKLNIELNSFGANFDPFVALKEGNVDVAIGSWTEPPDNFHYSHLYDDEMVCVMSKQNQYAKGMTKNEYLLAKHIAPIHYSVGKEGVVDTYLSRHRLKRNVVASVPFFNLAPHALPNTDLIFTVNRSLGAIFSEKFDLALVESPLPFPIVKFVQLWHERTHFSPACIWLRNEIQLAASTASFVIQPTAPARTLG